MTHRIGLLIGSESSLGDALLARLQAEPAVRGELVVVGGTPDGAIFPYDAIIDRISHRVPCYRSYLCAAALAGCAVLSDPFALSAQDKFFGLSLAKRMGLAVPRTMLLPQKSYGPEVSAERSLRNLQYPIDWGAIGSYVGYPALLRPCHHGAGPSWRVASREELWQAFEECGQRVMMLQHSESAPAIEVLCAGGKRALVLGDGLSPRLVNQARRIAIALSQRLGYGLSRVELSRIDSELCVLDAGEAFPELDRAKLGGAFDTLVSWLAEQAIAAARSPVSLAERHRWAEVPA